MLAQAQNMMTEEVQSPKRTDMLIVIETIKKAVSNQVKDEALKDNSNKTPLAGVDLISFILSQFQANIDWLNSLIGDVLAKEVEWAKLSKDIVVGLAVMQFTRLSEDMT